MLFMLSMTPARSLRLWLSWSAVVPRLTRMLLISGLRVTSSWVGVTLCTERSRRFGMSCCRLPSWPCTAAPAVLMRLVSESRVGLSNVLRIWSKSTTGLVAVKGMVPSSAMAWVLSDPGTSWMYFWPSRVASRTDAEVSTGSGHSLSSMWKVTDEWSPCALTAVIWPTRRPAMRTSLPMLIPSTSLTCAVTVCVCAHGAVDAQGVDRLASLALGVALVVAGGGEELIEEDVEVGDVRVDGGDQRGEQVGRGLGLVERGRPLLEDRRQVGLLAAQRVVEGGQRSGGVHQGSLERRLVRGEHAEEDVAVADQAAEVGVLAREVAADGVELRGEPVQLWGAGREHGCDRDGIRGQRVEIPERGVERAHAGAAEGDDTLLQLGADGGAHTGVEHVGEFVEVDRAAGDVGCEHGRVTEDGAAGRAGLEIDVDVAEHALGTHRHARPLVQRPVGVVDREGDLRVLSAGLRVHGDLEVLDRARLHAADADLVVLS